MEKLSDRPMRRLRRSRRELFEKMERGALRSMPDRLLELSTWAQPRVSPNNHVLFEAHFYSAPHTPIDEQLDFRPTKMTVRPVGRGSLLAA